MSIFGTMNEAIFGDADAAPVAPARKSTTPEEIDQRLAAIAAEKGASSNYKTSIVNLMELFGLDSSLTSRAELAKELGYAGDTNDSATMNIWLREQVMKSLASRSA
ncbi:MAG: DUF3597 domain-containing protein [Sphingomonadaceae bacterium]|nr:DUF3597 domain-containing protein [Sphingomonadaceae bacterium]